MAETENRIDKLRYNNISNKNEENADTLFIVDRLKSRDRPLIKICGMTTAEDIHYANTYRPDLIGCVMFFPKSKRNISGERAADLLRGLSRDIAAVAVTVSPTVEQLKQIETIGFHLIQIHGILSEDVYREAEIPILRAFNVTDLDEYENMREMDKIAGYVFDAETPGSGRTFDWSLLKEIPPDGRLCFLAGGIHGGNVKEAIRQTEPDGIDLSSAVEKPDLDGKHQGKDPEKIKNIIKIVRNEIID